MSEPYIGEVRLFAGSFTPVGWGECNGDLLSVADYSPLFSLIGTTYGGDGQTTFGVPDLRGRVPVGQGNGPGLTGRIMGEIGGEEQHTLTSFEMPQHSHTVSASTTGGVASPAGAYPAAGQSDQSGVRLYTTTTAGTGSTSLGDAISVAGGSAPHENMQPYLGVRYIICLEGIYPSQQ